MATIWLIGDTHFGHANILTFSDKYGGPLRSFHNVHEMDEHMVECWNSVVKPQDHVYHLGDVTMKAPGLGIVARLNGHKRLVRGNHDIFKTKQYLQFFEEIYGVRILNDVILSHIPIHPDSLKQRWHGNVHGHLHSNKLADRRYLNASVECINYTPITIEDAIARLKRQQEGA